MSTAYNHDYSPPAPVLPVELAFPWGATFSTG